MLPINHSPIPMRNDLEANKSEGFVIQHSRIQVGSILFLDTKYSGKFCDRQNVLMNSNKSCGCFSLKSSCYNIIYMHSIFFPTDTSETNMMRKFSSLDFWRHPQKGTSEWISLYQGCNQEMMLTGVLLMLLAKLLI